MTVMPSTSDVADKAVSTDDGGSGVEVARLEAVLAALVETKVEAMKASSTLSRRSGSAPASPRKLRLTSTSTASSSLNHHHHHHHHHPHQHQQQHRRKSHHHHHHHHHHHRRKRHDSAPCGDYIDEPISHKTHHGKGRRRASESPRSPRKKRRHSKSPHVFHGVQDVHTGLDSRFELLGLDGEQDLALINFERTREALSDSCDYPRLHRSACYFSQSAAQLKIHYDDDDYVALNVADELEEEETLSGPEKIEETRERYHKPRRKRKRKRRKVDPVGVEEELADPEELPPRARWTIVATACLLLAMSLLLVGVTLRMAPIIDDMGPKRKQLLSGPLNTLQSQENCSKSLTMSSNRPDNHNRRPSGSSSERIIFYVDDYANVNRDSSPDVYDQHRSSYVHYPATRETFESLRMDEGAAYPSSPDENLRQADDRSILYKPSPDDRRRPSCLGENLPRRARNGGLEEQRSSRRQSVQAGRSRANSCAKQTPLGDGRRASTSKKTRPRRTSTARRKDSVRPTKSEAQEARKVIEDARSLEQARRHRRIAMIVLGTFLFLLTASVLVVVVTLTQSSFLSPATGSKELAEHRAQLRKENEELLNSLNRDSSVPVNSTTPP